MLISVEMSTFVPQKSAKKLFFIEVQTRVGLCTTLASGALFDLQENQLCTLTQSQLGTLLISFCSKSFGRHGPLSSLSKLLHFQLRHEIPNPTVSSWIGLNVYLFCPKTRVSYHLSCVLVGYT